MPAKIDIQRIRKKLNPTIVKKMEGAANRLAIKEFEKMKREELQSLLSDKVSIELAGGNTAEHINGVLDEGNLFSFIGFQEGREPVKELTDYLDNYITIYGKPNVVSDYRNGRVSFRYKVAIPSMAEIESETPLPWSKGRSWVRELEKGISGLAKYVYYEFFKSGRSKTGLQIGERTDNSRARGVPYISKFLQRLKSRFSINQ